jgi:hypothetical protein
MRSRVMLTAPAAKPDGEHPLLSQYRLHPVINLTGKAESCTAQELRLR